MTHKKRTLTAEEKAEIVAMVQAGMSIKEVAATYAVHYSTVHRLARRAERLANPPVPPPQMPGETKQQYGGRIYQWKMMNDPDFRIRMKRAHRGKRRRPRGQTEQRQPVLDLAPLASMPAPPPRPSLWQRLTGWLR